MVCIEQTRIVSKTSLLLILSIFLIVQQTSWSNKILSCWRSIYYFDR